MKPPTLDHVKSNRKGDRVPPGWFSRETLEKEWNLGTGQTTKLIRDSLQDGAAQMMKFRIDTGSRGLYPTPHYKFK